MIEDLPNLPYTRMMFEETLRLYPPVWGGLLRKVLSDDEISGYRISAKSWVWLSPYVTHRHPEYWNQPEKFDPERFTPERSADRPRYAYFPFGGGPRLCIGNNFALLEGQLIIATIAQRFQLQLVPNYPVEPAPLLSLGLRNGLPMKLHIRAR